MPLHIEIQFPEKSYITQILYETYHSRNSPKVQNSRKHALQKEQKTTTQTPTKELMRMEMKN